MLGKKRQLSAIVGMVAVVSASVTFTNAFVTPLPTTTKLFTSSGSLASKKTRSYEPRVAFDMRTQEEEPTAFDPLELAAQEQAGTNLPAQGSDDEPAISLWAARALLLLVAAIWGTNFAVCAAVM